MNKILTVGGATQDIFIENEDPRLIQLLKSEEKKSFIAFEEGLKIDVPEICYEMGGGATNSAVGFSRLGFNVETCFKIGKDQAANYILDRMKHFNISTNDIIQSEKQSTAISFILPTLSKNYTALCYRGANKHLKPEEMPFEKLKECDYVYITSLSGDSAFNLPEFTKEAKKDNLCVAVNPGSSQIIKYSRSIYDSLKYVDILILNAFEAEKCMRSILNIDSLKSSPGISESNDCPDILNIFMTYQEKNLGLYNFFNQIFSIGPKTVVVTDGAHGVFVGTPEFILFHPSLKTEIVNTIGAGDAFGAGFVGTIAQNDKVENALIKGIINSTSVIEHLDTKKGLLKKDQMEDRFNKIGTSKLKKYLWK